MTTLALTIALARRSAIMLPRRDLVLVASDDLALRLTIVAVDRPDAAPIVLTGGNVAVQLVVGRDMFGWDDYGWWVNRAPSGHTAWSGLGVIMPEPGRVNITLPRHTLRGPATYSWALQLMLEGIVSTMCHGTMQVMPGAAMAVPPPPAVVPPVVTNYMMTNTGSPIQTNAYQNIVVP